MKKIRKIARISGWIAGGILLLAVILLGIAWMTEYRPDANQPLRQTASSSASPLPDTLKILTWNIGYAGLGDNMDFFYDGGSRVRDTRKRTLENLNHIIRLLQDIHADVMLLQEVDLNSHRSYNIPEVDSLQAAFPNYTLSFAYNYNAAWVPIPVSNPLGRIGSGLVTLSRIEPLFASRIQYPSSFPFPVRLFNLKRCLLLSGFRTASADTILINNTHNTAYDTGDMRSTEVHFLAELLAGYLKRNIESVTGGDWNQYPPGYQPSAAELSNSWFVPEAVDSIPFGKAFRFVADRSQPSLRYLDRPFRSTDGSARPTTTLTDFFLISPGIRVLSVETIPLEFRWSDHHPVLITVVIGKRR